MENKQVVFSDKAREKLSEGAQLLNDAVSATLGPLGRTALIQNGEGIPVVTKDGYTVTKSIKVKDPIKNMSINLLKQVASKVVDEVGDNTTTSTVLANSIFQQGLAQLDAGINPIQMQKGMNLAVDQIVKNLHTNSKAVETIEDIEHVATISCNNDEYMGKMIAHATYEVGSNGTINVQKSDLTEDDLSIVFGMSFNRSYQHPYFITNPGKLEVEYKNALILLTVDEIRSMASIMSILEHVQKEGKPLVIIGKVSGDALAALVENKIKNIIQVVTVDAPGVGDRSKEMLEDIAVLTNAKVINSDGGNKLIDINPEWLGQLTSIKVDKVNTAIINENADQAIVQERVNELEVLIDNLSNEYDIEKTKERIARLVGGVAVIKAGGFTDVEILERKDRLDDGVAAVKAAQEEGIIIGGGAAYLHASKKWDEFRPDGLSDAENKGWDIIFNACEAPFIQICKNAGFDEEQISNLNMQICSENKITSIGYNLLSSELEDLFETGIIDSLKGARISLETATSAASTLLTTETVVYDETK